nr:SDR family oxidoreductase [Candidatus Njordarchaeota archaeon]
MEDVGLLAGKVAVITGSGRGIGRATALLFAKEGASVLINDLDAEPANETVAEIKKMGGKAAACLGNVSKPEDAKKILETAAKTFGKIDILVNNAGITRDKMIHNMTDEMWDTVLNVCLRGTFNMIRAVAPHMREPAKKEQEEGKIYHRKIINVSSIAGIRGSAGNANYAAAKAGIMGITRAIASEWAQFRINVNCVAPGMVETRLTAPKKEGDELGLPENLRDMALATLQWGAAQPEDIAKVILFFASDLSNFVTGEVLCIRGPSLGGP